MNILPMGVRMAIMSQVVSWRDEQDRKAKGLKLSAILNLQGGEYEYAAGLLDGMKLAENPTPPTFLPVLNMDTARRLVERDTLPMIDPEAFQPGQEG